MRLWLVANARFPTEWAHGGQIASMASAFAALGHDVEVVVPDRPDAIAADPAAFYGVSGGFSLRRLPDLGPLHRRPLASAPQRLSFALAAGLACARLRPALVLSRDEVAAAACAPWSQALVEVHKLPVRALPLYGALLRRAAGVVSTNQAKAQRLSRELGVPAGRILVAQNGADVGGIQAAAPRPDVRAELGLPHGARLVLYSGHLHAWKGVETLVAAAAGLSEQDHVLLLGGRDEDVARFRAAHAGPRVHVLGRVPRALVAGWLKAADVLVLPNVGSSHESRHETSPLKLLEYMASGRPIVASDLPSLREILDGRCALLVQPDDPRALAAGIRATLEEPVAAAARAQRALERVQSMDWSARAGRILDFALQLPGGHSSRA